MKYLALIIAVGALAACENMDSNARTTAGALGGAAAGVGVASALGGGSTAKTIGGLAGGAAGVAVAQNQQPNSCIATRSDGTQVRVPCN